jgi:hypothetical protein
MRWFGWVCLSLCLLAAPPLLGCAAKDDAKPSQEQIQKQLERDAAMRAEEDRLNAAEKR